MCSLDLLQTRAPVWSCAPRPAAGQSGGMRWSGGRTGHNGTSQARRPRHAARLSGHPYEPDGRDRQGGGWQSGAAGEMPPAKQFFADGPKDNEGQKRTVNRPAEVAMGRKSSYTARPDGNAARHTDARSLAIPVPRGTMIPTAAPPGATLFGTASSQPSAPEIRSRLRRSIARVYASRRRLRTFFQHLQSNAHLVPKPFHPTPRRHCRLIRGIGATPGERRHGKNDRMAWQNGAVEAGDWKILQAGDRRSRRAGPSISRFWKIDGNLGMFGKPRKFLLPPANHPSPTLIQR